MKIQYKIIFWTTGLITFIFFILYFLLKPYFQESFSLKQTFLIIFCAVILPAVFLNFIVTFWIAKPLVAVITAVEKIATGDFDQFLRIRTCCEMESLSKVMNDLAEKMKARIEEMTTSKSRLEAVLLSIFEGIMVVDKEGKILFVNRTLQEFLSITTAYQGYKPIEVIRNIEIQNITDKTLRLNKGVESKELTLFLPEEKIILIHAAPVVHHSGIDGVVLVFHDISELRRLERVRADFVANVSHELRTPISTIKGYAETLLDGALEDKANAKDFIQIIYSDADRLAKLINDILDLSKIESGKIDPILRKHTLSDILDPIFLALEPQIKEKKISVKKDIPLGLAALNVDEMMMKQVIFNLIENAIKYNKEEGSIQILAQDRGSEIEIQISDTGIGIPEKDLSRIFERFYRVDRARSRELGGTGLGLSIVKHLTLAQGGHIAVKSHIGQGSIFTVVFPKA